MSHPLGARWPGRARGQATVELALVFPVIALAVLVVLQLALVGRDAVLVSHAAREATRAAAVDPSAATALAGARGATTGLDPTRLQVALRRSEGRITVEVTYQAITGLPLVGVLVPDPELRSQATMRDETG